MPVFRIAPLGDPRWTEFVERHPKSSIFHTTGWLEALSRTYGYEPVAYTTTPPGRELTCGIPFCHIRTWLTGRRLVSLPFSDHCNPLVDTAEDSESLLDNVRRDSEKERCRYVELRPKHPEFPGRAGFLGTEAYCLHTLDLRPDLDEIFRGFHRDCIQRKIRRADREGLTCEEGTSDALLGKFYRLLLRTRRRHGLPPQPLDWFRNLISCLRDRVRIFVASKDQTEIASILTLSHKQMLVYKYGCSVHSSNNLGGTQFLFWKVIESAKKAGFSQFDLGRSDAGNSGLITFKDRWGAESSPLVYFRYPPHRSLNSARAWQMNLASHLFACVPDGFLAVAGRLLYKHIG